MDLSRLPVQIKTGSEPFHSSEAPTGATLVDFWRWSTSDLVSNATRGVLAEFIIARALEIPFDQPREEWASWDLTTTEGIKVEVKSAAYLQSWHQSRLSPITFNTPKTRAWDAETNQQSEEIKRQADVYVLALLAHQDKSTIDPLNLDQWKFFVLPTAALDGRTRSQHSITLPSLETLHGPGISFPQLREAVHLAYRQHQAQVKAASGLPGEPQAVIRRGEPCFRGANGELSDEGLHQLEPEDPEGYRLAGIETARRIGLSEATIAAVYGVDSPLLP